MDEIREKIEVRVEGTERDGDLEWTVLNQTLFGRKRWLVRATKDGVEQRFDGRTETLIKFPLKDGLKWTEQVAAPEGGSKERACEVREETIEVPAGKLDCLRVDRKVEGELESMSWYSRGVGLVKHIHYPGKKSEQTFSLVSSSVPAAAAPAHPCRSGGAGCVDARKLVHFVCKKCGKPASGTPRCVLCRECAKMDNLCPICEGRVKK
jgi:hypothetical protein